MNKMQSGKAAGSTGVMSEMLLAGGGSNGHVGDRFMKRDYKGGFNSC